MMNQSTSSQRFYLLQQIAELREKNEIYQSDYDQVDQFPDKPFRITKKKQIQKKMEKNIAQIKKLQKALRNEWRSIRQSSKQNQQALNKSIGSSVFLLKNEILERALAASNTEQDELNADQLKLLKENANAFLVLLPKDEVEVFHRLWRRKGWIVG